MAEDQSALGYLESLHYPISAVQWTTNAYSDASRAGSEARREYLSLAEDIEERMPLRNPQTTIERQRLRAHKRKMRALQRIAVACERFIIELDKPMR